MLRVPGLRGSVSIGRDRWGIPHVDARTDADAWYALGFCQGQDRAFQLEILLRAGRGTLAELVGPAALPIDRLTRTLGLAALAEQQRAALDADVSTVVDAYAAGVNAAFEVSPRPHELVLLRAPRSSWRTEDVMAFMTLQSLALAGNWDTELARLRILLADGPDAVTTVAPWYGAWLPTVTSEAAGDTDPLARLASDIAALHELVGAGASNAWAVDASRSSSGAPLLANDPHLAPSVPAPWYLAHLRTPEWEIAGPSFVGSPAFPSGHNGHLAWGITAACTDSSDLFWERLDLEAGTARGPGGPEPITRSREEITVRGAGTHVEEVMRTARGPIVTPLLDDVETALSLRATWLEPAAVRGFVDAPRARDAETLRAAFAGWPGPGLNVVVAERTGEIGHFVVGTLPRRRTGNGTLPQPAWDPSAGWLDEHLAPEALPAMIGPPAGLVASANNPPAGGPGAPFLGVDWLDGYRAARITERLGQRDDWDVAGFLELQLDLASVPWRELRDLVLVVEPSSGDARRARDLLENWDGVVGADSVGAAVYELFVTALASAVAREAAPRGWRWALGTGFGACLPRTTFGARIVSGLVARLRDGSDGRSLIDAALAEAVGQLSARAGPNPSRWAWGRIRPLRLRHVLDVRRPLDRIFALGPVPLGGDANTVAQAGVRPLDPTANPSAIANHRTVIDLADPERSRYVLCGGQSGNPLSPHYADQFDLWRRGKSVPIPWSPEAVEAATVERLLLRPRLG